MNKALTIKFGKSLRLLAIIALTIYYLISLSRSASAQETIRTYTISPPTINQKLDPGQNIEGKLKVINGTDSDLSFNVSIRDFIVEDTLGTPKFLPNNMLSNKYSAASWIQVAPSSFTVKSKQIQELSYYIHIPLNARPGGHYAAVVYAPSNGIELGGTGTIVNTEAGSLFYITISGPIKEDGLVSKFLVNPSQEYGPIKILTQIKNLGDLHIAPKASITVSGPFYSKTQELQTHNIFPEAARDFENTFGQTWMIGRYKASLLGTYGTNNNLPLIATTYFWVFPWRISLVIILSIVALILFILYLRKRSKERNETNELPPVSP